MSDVPWISGASASKNIAQDNAKFSWDLVRIRLGSLTCAIVDSTLYLSSRLQKNFTGIPGRQCVSLYVTSCRIVLGSRNDTDHYSRSS